MSERRRRKIKGGRRKKASSLCNVLLDFYYIVSYGVK
jgi:hypothetical protein